MDDDGGPVLALDQIKRAGIPIRMQMSPYLQMDPNLFRNSTPQYILPEGASANTRRLELSLGRIGSAICVAYVAGVCRGAWGELRNADTRQLTGRPWWTRMLNASAKHGSGWAQPAGVALLLYSILDIGIGRLRGVDDDTSSFLAGTLTGAIYRSPHGMRAAGIGAGVGLGLAVAWNLANSDSRQRMMHMMNMH